MATYYGDVKVGVVSGSVISAVGALRPSSGQLWPRGSGKN